MVTLAAASGTHAGQAPGRAADPDVAISHRDRRPRSTVSVTDPVDHRVLGVIRLGDPAPANFSPLYRGQLLVHGLGFAPDHRTLAVVSIGSNSITLIDTATNAVKHTAYVGRSPHEAFFTPSGQELWVTVRGESHIAVLDGATYAEKTRIAVPNGPGMQIFSPDGVYGYVCSSFTAETVVISVASHEIVGRVPQASPFCPNIAATPDGSQVWFTLKDVGKTTVFAARPPFSVLTTIDTGPITNHVNFARNARGTFAYVSVGGLNEVQVFRTDDFSKVATIPVGRLPHGLWPSGDGTRIYVGLENDDRLVAIDTLTNAVIATMPIGQAPQALVYVTNAVPQGDGTQGVQPLGLAGQAAQLSLVPAKGGRSAGATAPTRSPCSTRDWQVPKLRSPLDPNVLTPGLALRPDGGGPAAMASFTTNAAGAAVVDAIGPSDRSSGGVGTPWRYLVIAPGSASAYGVVVQIQRAPALHLLTRTGTSGSSRSWSAGRDGSTASADASAETTSAAWRRPSASASARLENVSVDSWRIRPSRTKICQLQRALAPTAIATTLRSSPGLIEGVDIAGLLRPVGQRAGRGCHRRIAGAWRAPNV